MDSNIINQIFQICILPLLGILTTWFVKFVNVKIQELQTKTNNEKEKKYLDMLNNTITDCVIATTQTYVETLKKENKFDAEAQQEAFNRTFSAVLDILSDDAKEYLNEALGDFDDYVTQKIESEVNKSKLF